jgi:hypothetical protein
MPPIRADRVLTSGTAVEEAGRRPFGFCSGFPELTEDGFESHEEGLKFLGWAGRG